MGRAELLAWAVAAVALVAGVVDLLVRPMHWERTLIVALVVLVIAAGVGVTRRRGVSRS